MTPDLRFIPDTAQAQPNEFPIGSAGHGFRDGGLPHAWRTDKTEDRTLVLLDEGLNGKIFDDPLLNFLKTMMVLFKNGFRILQRMFVFRFFGPWHVEQPVNIITDHRCLGRHRGHHLHLFDFLLDLLVRLFGELLLFQPFFQLCDFVAKIVLLPHLLLDRPHLFIEVIILLGLFHLLFDPSLDLLLNLKNLDLRKHQFIDRFHPFRDIEDFDNFLFVFQFGINLGNDDIGQL